MWRSARWTMFKSWFSWNVCFFVIKKVKIVRIVCFAACDGEISALFFGLCLCENARTFVLVCLSASFSFFFSSFFFSRSFWNGETDGGMTRWHFWKKKKKSQTSDTTVSFQNLQQIVVWKPPWTMFWRRKHKRWWRGFVARHGNSKTNKTPALSVSSTSWQLDNN